MAAWPAPVTCSSTLRGQSFRRHARLDFAGRCRIVPAEHGVAAGLIGAAALVLAGETYWERGAD